MKFFGLMLFAFSTLFFLSLSVSEKRLQGKSQLFFHTQAVPEGMSCQVQPNTGCEIHTHFSIFCSSGKEVYILPYTPLIHILNFSLIWSWCNCVCVFRISYMNTVLVWATIQRNSFTKAGISNITLVFLVEILMTITKVQRFNNEADFIIISHKQAISYFRNPPLFPPQSQSILK